MKTSELVFIGIRGSVVALERATGKQVWATRLKSYDFVNILFQDNLILATTYGEVFCLDPLNGTLLWHNRLKGYGIDLATIAPIKRCRPALLPCWRRNAGALRPPRR